MRPANAVVLIPEKSLKSIGQDSFIESDLKADLQPSIDM